MFLTRGEISGGGDGSGRLFRRVWFIFKFLPFLSYCVSSHATKPSLLQLMAFGYFGLGPIVRTAG